MAIQTFFMANLDYAVAVAAVAASCGGKRLLCRALCVVGHWPTATAASCAVLGVLLDVGPSFKEGHNVLDFGLQERVNWREEIGRASCRERV